MNDIRFIVVGQKAIRFENTAEGNVTAVCACNCLETEIRISLTQSQAAELMMPRQTRRHVQDILPNHSKEVREVFISGTTPAEYDQAFFRRMRTPEEYTAMGYLKVDPMRLNSQLEPHQSQSHRRRMKI